MRVDLTRVDARTVRNGADVNSHCSYEVEVELTPKALTNKEAINYEDVVEIERYLSKIVNVARDPHWFGDKPVSFCDRSSADASKALSVIAETFGQFRGFPGSMPVNFRRKNIAAIADPRNDYYVSEKTDGERYFVCILRTGEAYLVNRLLNVERIIPPLAKYLAQVCMETHLPGGREGGGNTLLDIELVRNLNTFELVFMIFDAMLCNGENLLRRPLTDRLTVIGQLVGTHRKLIANRKFPIVFIGKAFIPVAGISAFKELVTHIDGIDQHGSEPRRVYDDHTKRCHFSDGLIFALNAPYQSGADMNLIKWKYPAYCTIDFKFKRPEKVPGQNERWVETTLYTADNSGPVVFCNGYIDCSLLDRRSGRDKEIGEFYYDRVTDSWRLCGLRSNEKNRPNSNLVAVDVLASLVENVTFEELEYRIRMHDSNGVTWRQALKDAESKAINQLIDSIPKV